MYAVNATKDSEKLRPKDFIIDYEADPNKPKQTLKEMERILMSWALQNGAIETPNGDNSEPSSEANG